MTGKRGPKPTSERVKRLLVMLPWLMEQSEARTLAALPAMIAANAIFVPARISAALPAMVFFTTL